MFLCLGKADNVMENDMYTWLVVVSRNEGENVHLLTPLHTCHLFSFYGCITKALAERAQVNSDWLARWTSTAQPLEEDTSDGLSLPLP